MFVNPVGHPTNPDSKDEEGGIANHSLWGRTAGGKSGILVKQAISLGIPQDLIDMVKAILPISQ